MSIQGWFPLGLTDLIFFLSKGLFKSSPAPQLKASILWCSAFFMVQLSHQLSLASLKIFFGVMPHGMQDGGFQSWIESVPLPWKRRLLTMGPPGRSQQTNVATDLPSRSHIFIPYLFLITLSWTLSLPPGWFPTRHIPSNTSVWIFLCLVTSWLRVKTFTLPFLPQLWL